jgi:hypothetical protein
VVPRLLAERLFELLLELEEPAAPVVAFACACVFAAFIAANMEAVEVSVSGASVVPVWDMLFSLGG